MRILRAQSSETQQWVFLWSWQLQRRKRFSSSAAALESFLGSCALWLHLQRCSEGKSTCFIHLHPPARGPPEEELRGFFTPSLGKQNSGTSQSSMWLVQHPGAHAWSWAWGHDAATLRLRGSNPSLSHPGSAVCSISSSPALSFLSVWCSGQCYTVSVTYFSQRKFLLCQWALMCFVQIFSSSTDEFYLAQHPKVDQFCLNVAFKRLQQSCSETQEQFYLVDLGAASYLLDQPHAETDDTSPTSVLHIWNLSEQL